MVSMDSLTEAGRHWGAPDLVHLFQKLGPGFPRPNDPEDVWQYFVLSCTRVPFALLISGTIATVVVIGCSCCRHSQRRDITTRRPSSKCTSCTALIAFLFIILGSFISWQTGADAWHTAEVQLDHAIINCTTARDEGANLQDAGNQLLKNIKTIPPACAEQIQQPLDDLKAHVVQFMREADKYISGIKPLPDKLHSLKNVSETISIITQIGLLIPMIMVMLCCLSVVLAVLCSHRGSCSLYSVQCLGPALVAPTVILVTIAAAVQLEVAVVVSSFCADVDSNTLAYIKHNAGADSLIYEVSHYYIQQTGKNPLLEELHEATSQIQEVQSIFSAYGPAIEQGCPDWHGASNLSDSLARAKHTVDVGQQLLSMGTIRPYYEQMIHKEACQTAVTGLAWLVLFQALVGLFCLPCLILVAKLYLKRRRAWTANRGVQAQLVAGAPAVQMHSTA